MRSANMHAKSLASTLPTSKRRLITGTSTVKDSKAGYNVRKLQQQLMST